MRATEYQCQAAEQTEAPAPAGATETQLNAPVLFVTTSFPLHEKSTSGTFIKALVDALGDYCRLDVVTPADNRDLRVPDGRQHYNVHAFRYAPRCWQTLAHQPGGIPAALRRQPLLLLLLTTFLSRMLMTILLDGRKAALIHANWSISGVLAGIAGAVLEKPVVTTLRGSDVALAMHSRLFRYLLKVCIRLSTSVVTVSDTMAANVKQLLPEHAAKIMTIPNGVSEKLLAITPRTGQIARPLRLVSIGNLTPNKSVDTIIEAVYQLRDRAELRLRVIGGGPARASLETRINQLDLGNTVTLAGPRPAADIPNELATADILILASRSEGRPNVVLEAMAAGRTIIASDIEGTRELIEDGHNGLLFPPGDSKALAQHIQRVAADPDLSGRLGKAAHQTILDRQLTWAATAQRYYRLYGGLVGNKPARPD